MRFVSVVSALGLCLVLSLTASADDRLALIDYGQDLGLRHELIQQASVHADLGGRVVAHVSALLAVDLVRRGITVHSLAEPSPGEALGAVVANQWPPARPTGLRLLLVTADLVIVAGKPSAIRRLRRSGVYGGGVQVIDLGTRYRPTPAVAIPEVDAPDPRIAALVAGVQKANLINHLSALTTIHTRRATRPENALAVAYIRSELAKLPGLSVKVETFSTRYGPNIIAELPGLENPTEIVMVGAHLDSYVSGGSSLRSPGADDNGSGSAAVLEIARLLAGAPMQKTIRFAWWNAEEFGLIGSNAYAAAAQGRNDKIIAYINQDMNAYRDPNDTRDVDLATNDSTPSLNTLMTQMVGTYVPALGVKTGYLSAGTSDHRSFYRRGFPACFPFEDLDKYSPYIHKSTDDMARSTNDMDLSRMITQSVLAGVATLAVPLDPPVPTLDVTSGPSVGRTKVTASGGGLRSATAVKVGARAVPFTVVGNTVVFETPTSPVLGRTPVEISNPAGPGLTGYTYVLTTPPALVVPPQLGLGASATGGVGGPPGYLSVTLMSLLLGTTDMGVIKMDIGGGNPGSVVFYHIAGLSSGGGTTEFPIGVPQVPGLLGLSFHFQAAVVEPALQSVAKTNVGTLTVR